MYVKTSQLPQQWARTGLGAYVSSSDPAEIFHDTVKQASDRVGTAGLFGLAMLAGVGFLMFRSGRR